jgi:hypothetical protein
MAKEKKMSKRTNALAERLEQGARALEDFASGLSDEQWQMRLPHDGRKFGVIVHHVAIVYPLEIKLAATVAEGQAISGLTMKNIDEMNAEHATKQDGVTKAEALELLRQNSAAAAAAIRNLNDEDLDRAVPVSLYSDATVTCQFVLEDHAVRHSYHHLARLRAGVSGEIR